MRFAARIAATSEYEAVCTTGLRKANGSAARFEDFFGSDARMRSSRRSFWGTPISGIGMVLPTPGDDGDAVWSACVGWVTDAEFAVEGMDG